ncbi:hypothetical protein ACLBOM_30450 [Escherichia coli]
MAIWQDSYLCHVVRFSFWQAFLSALLSVVPAISSPAPSIAGAFRCGWRCVCAQ